MKEVLKCWLFWRFTFRQPKPRIFHTTKKGWKIKLNFKKSIFPFQFSFSLYLWLFICTAQKLATSSPRNKNLAHPNVLFCIILNLLLLTEKMFSFFPVSINSSACNKTFFFFAIKRFYVSKKKTKTNDGLVAVHPRADLIVKSEIVILK